MVRTRLVSMVFILTWGLECLRAQQNETLIEIANMPEKSINHGLQDKAGFIWLASHNGLFRYDGQRFEVFNTSSEPHLNANRIQSIHENNNTIWIGTEKGIDLLNLNTYQVQALNFEEVNVSVVDIQSYADTVWAMNSEGFIYRFENKLLTSKISNPFDTNGTFGSHPRLLYTSGNLLAISENKGCYKISGRQKPIVSKIDLASKESHWGFYQGKNDSIFIYGKTGLELINKNNRKFDSYQACKEHVYFFLKDYKNIAIG